MKSTPLAILLAVFALALPARAQDGSAPTDAQIKEATAIVQQAVKAMEPALWRVDVGIEERSSGVKTATWTEWKPSGTMTGLLQGKDYDLTSTGYPMGNARLISIGVKGWRGTDAGAAWHVNVRTSPVFDFMEMGPPLPIWVEHLRFEPAGREQHEDGTWLHMKVVKDWVDGRVPPEYWILLDEKGAPVRVRRIVKERESEEMIAMQVQDYLFTVDITPAKAGDKIAPPADAKALADMDAAVKEYEGAQARTKAQSDMESAQAEVTAAKKALAAAKDEAVSKAEDQARAHVRAAANPGDAGLAQDLAGADAASTAAKQAVGDAQTALDAKTAQMKEADSRLKEAWGINGK